MTNQIRRPSNTIAGIRENREEHGQAADLFETRMLLEEIERLQQSAAKWEKDAKVFLQSAVFWKEQWQDKMKHLQWRTDYASKETEQGH